MGRSAIALEDALARLQSDKMLLVELIQILLDDAPAQFKRLRQMIGRADLEKIADAAHSLRGAAANVGAENLAGSLSGLEKAATEKDRLRIKESFTRATKNFQELKAQFPKIKKQLAG